MPARITHDVVATIGSYKDRQSGEQKKRYVTIGKCFTDDQGRQSIKLDSVPVSPEWSGWISLYPVRDRDGSPQQQPRQQLPPGRREPAGMPPAPAAATNYDEDENIPF